MIEAIAEFDEEILEEYYVGNTNISREILLKKLKKGCAQRKAFPLLCGFMAMLTMWCSPKGAISIMDCSMFIMVLRISVLGLQLLMWIN